MAVAKITVQEFSTATTTSKVDREAKRIRGVKFLGRTSKNGREYPTQATERALRLYESRPIYANHPEKPNTPRDVRTLIGWTRDPVNNADGVYGDVEYLESEPMAMKLVEVAERNPSVLGFSHVADISEERRGGRKIVESIDRVVSVDMVAEGATTNGIFEEVQHMKTWKEHLTKLFAGDAARIRVLEMDGAPEAMAEPVPADAPSGGSAEEQTKAAFRAMIIGALDDDSLDIPATIKKIKDLLTMQEKLLAGDSAASPSEPPADAPATESVNHSLAQTVAKLQRQLQIREMCDDAGVKPTKVLTRALEGAADAAEMKAFIDEFKQAQPAGNGVKPKSAGRVQESPAANSAGKVTDAASLAKACFS